MTQAQKQYQKKLIQKIQISKHNRFLNDEERKAFMLSRFGKSSTTEMTIDQLKLFLDFCNRKVSDIPMLNEVKDKELATYAQISMIRASWKEKASNKNEEALLAFAKKITKYKMERLEDLLKGKATKVIQALENMNNKNLTKK